LPATITAAPAVTGTNAPDFGLAAGSTCDNGVVIAANGGSCVVNIAFVPLAPVAPMARTAILNLSATNEAAGASPHAVTLNGTATQPGLSLSTSAEPDFGNVQIGATATGGAVTLTNSGTGPLTITGITFAATSKNAADFARATTCPIPPATLAAGAM